jgi:hypothetical protein
MRLGNIIKIPSTIMTRTKHYDEEKPVSRKLASKNQRLPI